MTFRVKDAPKLTDLNIDWILNTTLAETVYITPQYPYVPEFDHGRISLDCRNNRRYVTLLRQNKSKFYTSFARYYYSVYHSTIIPSDLEVDHDDNNTLNDYINNLKLLTQRENALKQNSIQQYPGSVSVIALCPSCGTYFSTRPRDISFCNHLQNRLLFCTNSCHQKSKSVYLPEASIDYIKRHQLVCSIREYKDDRVILEWINPDWLNENCQVSIVEKRRIEAYRYGSDQERILSSIKQHMVQGRTYAEIARLTNIRWTIVRHHINYYPEYFGADPA